MILKGMLSQESESINDWHHSNGIMISTLHQISILKVLIVKVCDINSTFYGTLYYMSWNSFRSIQHSLIPSFQIFGLQVHWGFKYQIFAKENKSYSAFFWALPISFWFLKMMQSNQSFLWEKHPFYLIHVFQVLVNVVICSPA